MYISPGHPQTPLVLLFRIPENQTGLVWKAPLEALWSDPLFEQGHPEQDAQGWALAALTAQSELWGRATAVLLQGLSSSCPEGESHRVTERIFFFL